MYLQYRNLKLIEISGRPDEDNKKILNGDYLNKSLKDFEMPSKDEMMKYIFSDWQVGDILVIADSPLKYPKVQGDTLVEMTREEICESGDLSILQDGEIFEGGKIITVPAPENLLKKVWDKEAHIWKEGATEEEIKNFYYSQINKFKAEILEVGFNYNGHQQKCREKDLALLGNAVSALDDMQMFSQEEHKINWAFNDNDIVNMSEMDLRELRMQGAIFINVVYGVEAELKSSKPYISLKKEDFITRVDELSDVKCYKSAV